MRRVSGGPALVTPLHEDGSQAGWKAALAEAGVCAPHPAPPGTPLSETERDRLREVLAAEDASS